jgi:hypothetical protein
MVQREKVIEVFWGDFENEHLDWQAFTLDVYV